MDKIQQKIHLKLLLLIKIFRILILIEEVVQMKASWDKTQSKLEKSM